MEQKKKQTNGQLQRRIERAAIHLDRTKETKEIFFSDKGLRLVVDANEGYALVETGYHTHYFKNFTMSGLSRPFLYTQRMVEIALDNDCHVDDGYSFARLLDVLKAKSDQSEYNIAMYYSWWVFVIFDGLYSIGESEVESFIVYLDYVFGIAKNSILLSEKTEDMTNKQFVERTIANMRDFTDNLTENILFHKKTDEEVLRENIDAVMEQETEDFTKEQMKQEEENDAE